MELPSFLIFLKLHTSSHRNTRLGRAGSVEFACDRGNCGKRFKDRVLLRNHLNIHDNILAKCHFCPWTGNRSVSHIMVKHFNTHFRIRPYSCSICDAKFYDKSTRHTHELIVHENIKLVRKCGSCDFESLSWSAYDKHIKSCEERKLDEH